MPAASPMVAVSRYPRGSRSDAASSPSGDVRSECDAMAARVIAWCAARGMRLAAAESLTGGLLADAFVRIPGASAVFLGSAVTYDIRAKASVLGVDKALLRRHGAVHPQVACQMAQRCAWLYGQDGYDDTVIGVSTTGVAGPGPDGGQPAGLVYVGLFLPTACSGGEPECRSVELRLPGSRDEVRSRTVWHVLRNLSCCTVDSRE